MKVRYTEPAARQLDAILDYIAVRSPQGAGKVIDGLDRALDVIGDRPYVGQTTSRRGFRRLVLNPYPYVVLYRLSQDEIIIHSIRHAARKRRGW